MPSTSRMVWISCNRMEGRTWVRKSLRIGSKPAGCRGSMLIRGLVFAGCAAGLAIHEPIGANADIQRRLAKTTELLALAAVFRLLALRATIFCQSGSGTHSAKCIARPVGTADHVRNLPAVSCMSHVRSAIVGPFRTPWPSRAGEGIYLAPTYIGAPGTSLAL